MGPKRQGSCGGGGGQAVRAHPLGAAPGGGVGKTTIGRWVASGYLHPALPGVYAVGHTSASVEATLAEALLYAGPGACLSHDTAVWWLGLLKHPTSPRIAVTTPRRVQSVDGIVVHGRRHIDRIPRRGLTVAAPHYALLDLAANATDDLLRLALANADFHGLLDLNALDAITGRGIAGSAAIKDALQRHRPELAHTRSKLERRLLMLCERHRLPIPRFNVQINGWLADAYWPEARLVVEVDGLQGHRTRAQLESDHQRDFELRRAGYIVLRYTWRQLTDTPAHVAEDIRRIVVR